MILKKPRPTGKCYICGKRTKLPIHGECGNRVKRRKADKVVKTKNLKFLENIDR